MCSIQYVRAQSKSYNITIIAEGNFGTPNGDIYKVSRQVNAPPVKTGPAYQTANGTTGIDVLQDFEYFGNRAVLCGKGSNPVKMAIVNFPGYDSVITFDNNTFGAGIQTIGKASNTKVYVSGAGSSAYRMIDLTNNTVNVITDPNSQLSGTASYMVPANGFIYIATGSKIVKVDTATNTVTATIQPGLGTIAGMVADPVRNCIWILGKTSNVSALMKLEPNNNDFQHAPVALTGITNAKLLRYGADKLYFVSGLNVHAYSISNPVIPVPAVYTTTLNGNSFSIFYGRAFAVDAVNGDFAIASAGNFSQPSTYEIVDGTTYTLIDTGSVDGRIVNKLFLNTSSPKIPSWDTTALENVYAQCDTTLTEIPKAYFDDIYYSATTAGSLTFRTQGSHPIIWEFNNGNMTVSQLQEVIIEDTIAPVPDVAVLDDLTENCPYTLTAPTASDNCAGAITGTTPVMTFTEAGTYTVLWTYRDAGGNSVTQAQKVTIQCDETNVPHLSTSSISIYPNPAQDQLTVSLKDHHSVSGYTFCITDMLGKIMMQGDVLSALQTIDISQLQAGLYQLTIQAPGTGASFARKVVITR